MSLANAIKNDKLKKIRQINK